MSMSTYVKGLISPEHKTYKKHASVLRACIDANIEKLPKETADYFGSEYPDEYLFEEKLEVEIPKHEWDDGDMSQGYEIVVSEIPAGVHTIRFVNSW